MGGGSTQLVVNTSNSKRNRNRNSSSNSTSISNNRSNSISSNNSYQKSSETLNLHDVIGIAFLHIPPTFF